MKRKLKEIVGVVKIPVVVASLCCLSPIILVLFGLGSVAFAASLADTLYGTYKWVFRGIGLALILISSATYLRKKKGICTLDQAKKRRHEVINTIALAVIAGVIGYVVFLYVIVHYIGVFLGIWN